MKFEQLNLLRPILDALKELGYERPTPIQEKAIPPALEGRDVLGCAQTGTGKTCAFAVPILQRLMKKKPQGRPIRALILTPTRELAIQIQESFEAYGKHLPLRSAVIFGGVGQNPQVEQLKKGVDVLTATPGRLSDLHQQGLVDLSKLEIFVLDEADRMLDMGFIHDVKKILAWLPKEKQTLFFSATMPKEITDLVNSLLKKNHVSIAVNPISSPVEAIRQRIYFVDRGNKTALLAQLLEREEVTSALVFTRTKHGANKVARDLEKQGISAAAIHGNKSQTARQNALASFKDGSLRILVATDIAARGLDIEELPYVFNYNLPEVPETYVHRIGRTGRAGHEGVAISFCDFSEKEMLKDIEKLIRRSLPVVEEHDYPMQIFEAVKKDKHGRPINAEDAEARQAAKEQHQAKKQGSKAKAEASKAVPKPETPASKQKKGKKAASEAPNAPAPKQEAPKETPKAKKEKTYQRPLRTGSLEDYLNAPVEEYDYSEFPLLAQWEKSGQKDEPFMDATARMFATRSTKYRSAAPGYTIPEEKPEAPAPNGKQKKQGKKVEQPESKQSKPDKSQQAKQKKSGGKTSGGKQAPKAQEKQSKVSSGKQETVKQTNRLLKPSTRKTRKDDRPRPIERSIYATQKDSTEQKSLMKPYYITKD